MTNEMTQNESIGNQFAVYIPPGFHHLKVSEFSEWVISQIPEQSSVITEGKYIKIHQCPCVLPPILLSCVFKKPNDCQNIRWCHAEQARSCHCDHGVVWLQLHVS